MRITNSGWAISDFKVDKATAEQVIGLLLDGASMLTEFSFTADESRAATGLSLHATFTAPEAK